MNQHQIAIENLPEKFTQNELGPRFSDDNAKHPKRSPTKCTKNLTTAKSESMYTTRSEVTKSYYS